MRRSKMQEVRGQKEYESIGMMERWNIGVNDEEKMHHLLNSALRVSPVRDEMSIVEEKSKKQPRPKNPGLWRDRGDMRAENPNSGIFKIRGAKMNKIVLISMLLVGFVLAGCGKSGKSGSAKDDTTIVAAKKAEKKILYWYDPMSPTIHFDHPGKSPTMDMDLVPKYADEGSDNPNVISVDPAMVQNFGVVIAPVERRKLTRTINTYGVIVPDEKNIHDINTRIGGWIEKLYFDYTGMNVRRHEAMAVIYSPELISAEQEFLQAMRFADVSANLPGQPNSLVKSARERLRFFGMSDKEIETLQTSGNIMQGVVIHSPADGVILEKDVFSGQNISAGQTLFRVANLSHVWVLADIFKIDLPYLRMGIPATVSLSDNENFDGIVDFIYPEVDAASRSVKARIEITNPHLELKVGQYVNVAIHSPISYDALAVPSEAVINTGLRKVVAVSLGEGKFEIRDVVLGAYADGYYEVLDGLKEGEDIVTSGQFLIDSDANLNSAGAAMEGMPGMDNGRPETGNRRNENGGVEGMKTDKGETRTGGGRPDTQDMKNMNMNHDH